MIEKIYIYHTNDLHSHLENWPTIHQFLSDSRKNHDALSSHLTLDIGDHLDRANIFTEGTLGKGNVQLLNEAQYDYVTIGNNEGITLSHENLETLYIDANFGVIISNFTDLEGNIPSWALPFKVHETPTGIKIGIVAATADYGIYYEKLGWHVQDPIPRLKEVCETLRPQVDVLICMSHLGMSQDEIISLEIPQVDVILGAHTHHAFEEGKLIGNTLQAATGKFGMNIGLVTLEFDHAAGTIQSKRAELFPTETLPVPPYASNSQLAWENEGIAEMTSIAFYNSSTLKKDWFRQSDLSHFFGKALISFTKADCAMFPAGIFLKDLQQGPITMRDLHQCLPHPINPCVITLTGAELLEVIRTGKNEKWAKLEVKGLGFRGKYLGAILYEQLQELTDGTVLVQETSLELEKIYTLATLDMFTFGYFFPSLKFAQKQYFMPEMIRDIVKWYGQLEKDEYES
ncbi:bifunctional metallophosphatase/5'-nucleotidase [Psychrobacillus antarcticus]|uniref:bifunctional metallophosphatase/5'-nucleotidase n=1 Tax=Psychrobacillus antarcticus TaxID=2879115 RepID=UPI002408828F|nr:5'-nucleotidase C-terminal domain-containing protein [Psychrobacillus antarcticus]